MAKTLTDKDFRVWEAFTSCGAHGFPDKPVVVFNCLSNRELRPRAVEMTGDEASAAGAVSKASAQELSQLFEQAREIR